MTPLIYSFFLLWLIGLCTMVYEVAKAINQVWTMGIFRGDILTSIELD